MSMNRDMIDVHLAYGSSGMTVRLPAAATTVITPRPREAAQDERATLREAIESPVAGPRLRELARPGQRVAISVCDVTRPQPRQVMLEALSWARRKLDREGFSRR
jgi:nickel-dependent lactate racemase